MLTGYLSKHSKSTVFSGQAFMRRWLTIFLASLFILVVSHILLLFDFTTTSVNLSFLFQTLQIVAVIALSGLLVSPFFFPGILYGLPRFPATVEISKGTATTTESMPVYEGILFSETTPNHSSGNDSLPPEIRSNTSKFESDYLDFIGIQTEQCMHDFKPYLQQDFNLAQLSVLVNIPVHHLAYYFREVKQMSFTDFRNRWRIKHAKNLIIEGKSNDLTLEAIGILSGFSSRNTFLLAFKKAEGISPQVFLSQIKKK
jgi:AraC-like DNA-binding protein